MYLNSSKRIGLQREPVPTANGTYIQTYAFDYLIKIFNQQNQRLNLKKENNYDAATQNFEFRSHQTRRA